MEQRTDSPYPRRDRPVLALIGATGMAVAMCAVDERSDFMAIERLIGRNLLRIEDHPFKSPLPLPLPTDLKSKRNVPFQRAARDAFGMPRPQTRTRSFRSRAKPRPK